MNDLRACYADGVIALGRQLKVGGECRDLCKQLRWLPDPEIEFLPSHEAEDLSTDNSADSRQFQMNVERFSDLAPDFRKASRKVAEVQHRAAWIEVNLDME